MPWSAAVSIPPSTDWARLRHAHGRAADVPGQQAALSGADPAVRRAALSALTGSALARRRSVALPDEALAVLVHADEAEVAGVAPGWDRSLRGHVAAVLRWLGL